MGKRDSEGEEKCRKEDYNTDKKENRVGGQEASSLLLLWWMNSWNVRPKGGCTGEVRHGRVWKV